MIRRSFTIHEVTCHIIKKQLHYMWFAYPFVFSVMWVFVRAMECDYDKIFSHK